MKSGGRTLVVDTANSRDLNNDGSIARDELRFFDSTTRQVVTPTANDTIVFNGRPYTWQQLETQFNAVTVRNGESLASAENQEPLSPDGRRNLLSQLEQQFGVVRNAQQQVEDARAALQNAPRGRAQTTAQGNLDRAIQNLRQQQQILQQQLAHARQRGIPENDLRSYSGLLGEPARGDGNGAGTGQFSARSMQMPGGGQPGPAGGAPQAGGARGFGMPGSGGYGDPMFAGMEPPTSAAYAAALYQDSNISDGLGQLMSSRREGQKLLMLFLYYARQAATGDPAAMYNFMKFITFIIAKDKARQNIHIGSKLIQLQDLSRKATETLMNADTTDPNKTQEFTKALHQAKSQEATISTSQKLLADMLQEFAGVTEGLISSTKNMQEFWMRASRRVTSQA